MADVTLQLGIMIQPLCDGGCVGESLFIPEIVSLAKTPEEAVAVLQSLLPRMLAHGPAADISKRQATNNLSIETVTLDIDPPPGDVAWRAPVTLTFRAVRWNRPDGVHVAYVPALQAAAVTEEAEKILPQLKKEIRFALQRQRAEQSLLRLAELQRFTGLELRHEEMIVSIKSAKQRAQEAADREAPVKSVLEEVGSDMAKRSAPERIGLDNVVEQLANALAGRAARSVLLVGPSGVGKTAAVHELVRRREHFGLGDRPFWATSGTRLIAGALGFGIWQERCHKLCREASAARAVLYLGNLIELLEIGQARSSTLSIAGFLRNYMARGELLAIAECTVEQIAVLERRDPHLLAVFRQIKVEAPSRQTVHAILRRVAAQETPEDPCPFSDAALETLQRLHRRYAGYSGFPGRPIRFIRNLLRDTSGQTPGPELITAAFARETGLPLAMIDDAVPLDIAAARKWFMGQVMAQDGAIDLIVDLLATLKAGLNRPRRPIASLLFIGPTGVGKTEMAKTLTEYFFTDRTRLTRFDMTEYNTAEAVQRLVGGFGRAEGLLTARIRQQPFSVVLFDEVEKAHSAFFDLMLQVLGEGRLTDASGRLADFTNSIIVMTSNLGAASFGRPRFGLCAGQTPDPAEHFTEEVRAFLRPELFNRIDRIVPFLPLNGAAIAAIARRELALLRQRDGLRLRDIAFDLDEESADYLAKKGFDAAYGARPLKRAIERELLAPLAGAINTYADDVPLTALVRVGSDGLSIRVRAATANALASAAGGAGPLLGTRAATVRRQVQRLEKSTALLDVHNEVFRLERSIAHEESAPPNHPTVPKWRQRVKRLRAPLDSAMALKSKIVAIEDAALQCFYEHGGQRGADWARQIDDAEAIFATVLLELYGLGFENPHQATVAIFCEQAPDLFALAGTYFRAAVAHQARLVTGWYAHDDRGLLLHRVEEPARFFAAGDGKPIGIVMELRAPHILPFFLGEAGSHVFMRGQNEPASLGSLKASDAVNIRRRLIII